MTFCTRLDQLRYACMRRAAKMAESEQRDETEYRGTPWTCVQRRVLAGRDTSEWCSTRNTFDLGWWRRYTAHDHIAAAARHSINQSINQSINHPHI